MYNILIADDDILLRNNLSMLLSGLLPDYQLCATAADGLEALRYLRSSSVPLHIVITDIKMPCMDGLELLSHISAEFPETITIVLSNYDEFEYVRTAMKYGIADYWLKHELNTDLIKTTLSSAVALLPDKLKPARISSTADLKENFIINLLTGQTMSEEKIRLNEKIFSFPVSSAALLPAVMHINSLNTALSSSTLSDSVIFDFTVKNMITELIDSVPVTCTPVNLSPYRYCLLFSFSSGCGRQEIRKKVYQILNLISVNIQKFLNTNTIFTIGNICRIYKELPRIFKDTEHNADNQFISSSQISFSSTQPIYEHSSLGLPYDLESRLSTALKTADNKSILSCMDAIFEYITLENLDLQSCQLIFSDLHKILTLTCKINHISYEEISPSHIPLEQIFSSVYDYENIRRRFYDSFLEVSEYLSQLQDLSQSHYVKAAVAIIQNSYQQDISLNNVADKIGISPGYLSTLFKSETSMSFTHYVNQLRIKKARIMLQDDSLSLEQIARECGYNNYDYFFKVFKKITGTTPSAYTTGSFSTK